MRLITRVLVNDIKFESLVFAYLRREDVYVRVEQFEMQTVGSPGFVIEVHPNLTRKRIFMDEVPRPCTAVVNNWLQKYGDYYEAEEGRNPIPAFTVTVGNRNLQDAQ